MIGIALSLLVAVLASIHDSAINKSAKNADEYIVALAMVMFSIPVILIALLWTGIPPVNKYFWIAVALKTPLMSLALLFRAKAHQRSEQSLIVPMLCFTPVFVMLLAPIFLHQTIKPLGIFGVLILVVGVYVMRITEKSKGFFEPFKALFRDTGVRYMLLVAFIWGFTATLDGVGVINAGGISSDIFQSFRAGAYWLIWTQSLSVLAFILVILAQKKKRSPQNYNLKTLIPIGITNGLAELVQMCAMGLIAAVYVNSIKRLSIIFSILIGHYYFKEKGIRERMYGASLMIIGFILIILSK